MTNLIEIERGKESPGRGTAQKGRVRTGVEGEAHRNQWTIKGLPANTVEATRDAARRSGMKLNSWIGRALDEAALAERGKAEPRPKAIANRSDFASVWEELSLLRVRNDHLEQTVNSLSTIMLKMLAAQK